jgi:hypothetical protein
LVAPPVLGCVCNKKNSKEQLSLQLVDTCHDREHRISMASPILTSTQGYFDYDAHIWLMAELEAIGTTIDTCLEQKQVPFSWIELKRRMRLKFTPPMPQKLFWLNYVKCTATILKTFSIFIQDTCRLATYSTLTSHHPAVRIHYRSTKA